MMRRKTGKLLAWILSCALLLGGCGSGGGADTSADTGKEQSGADETAADGQDSDETAADGQDATDGQDAVDGQDADESAAGGEEDAGQDGDAAQNGADTNEDAGDGEELGENIIVNPCFEDGELGWTDGLGSSQLVFASSQDAVADDVYTYGVVSRSPAESASTDCFAQDITQAVKAGEEYRFEFYAMLSAEYEGAPEDQRKVEFAPYVTVDGNTSYLGTYSSEITGNSSMALEPGVWTKFEGTFQIPVGKEPEQVVIRIIEQGTEYGQGECVKGDYCITGVSMREIMKEEAGIETDLPNLKDSVASEDGLGSDAIMGAGVTYGELTDPNVFALITKHFNAITLANELKPDCAFGYSNARCPGLTEVEFNGQTMEMPVMDFSRAEKMLDIILAWNEEHPDNKIMVRGHVLVWHSQTPEWFFHENFDASAPYVTKDEMNVRLEWYIKTMLGHYVGEDSKYKELFYGWDVVNEAVSDGTGTYRTDTEGGNDKLTDATHGSKSSWWHVYESNEYIINAFRYANKYAPADVELYYNDYNECSSGKIAGICALLEAVKAEEGEPGVGTRIDGMGMQGHYSEGYPTVEQLQSAVHSYAAIVGKVQFTEVDIKASGRYDGTAATRDREYTRMAYQYKTIYETLKALDAEEGVEVSGFTFWGVVDKYSWLQSASDVGGGADGLRSQCPLPFDGNYKAKPAFWAFVDPDQIPPYS